MFKIFPLLDESNILHWDTLLAAIYYKVHAHKSGLQEHTHNTQNTHYYPSRLIVIKRAANFVSASINYSSTNKEKPIKLLYSDTIHFIENIQPKQ